MRFSAGGEDGTPDPADAYDGDDLDELELTVNVNNVNEPGMVAISSLQPQIGTQMEATLSDDDVQVGFGQWRWASAPAKSGPFTNYLTPWVDENLDSDENTYRPVDDDLNQYLQVSVRYKDKVDDTVKTAQTVSEYSVRKDLITSNTNPKYPDQRTLVGGTPINRGTTWRYVPENSPAGTNVGAPVTAFDDETSIDVITYSLRDPAGSDDNSVGMDDDGDPATPPETDGHAASFNINPATGQITVAAGTRLNRADDIPTGDGPTTYSVAVIATDGDGHSERIAVTITVVKVNEPPSIDRVYSAATLSFTFATYDIGDRVPTEMSHYELDRTSRPARTIDTNLDTDVLVASALVATNIEPATYRATDPDPEDADPNDLTWSLEGLDATRLNAAGVPVPIFVFVLAIEADTLEPTATATKTTGPTVTLAFNQAPDFEDPKDTNKNNVYEVTLVVTDSTLVNRDELDVTVKVIDSTEDNQPGEVFLSNRQPEGASLLEASLEDPDKPSRARRGSGTGRKPGTGRRTAPLPAVL